MPQPRSKALELAKRRAVVAEMYLARKRQWEIAEALGVDQGTVSRDLAEIRAGWQESSLRDFSAAMVEELARIDELERTYWEAWQRSCKDAERILKEKITIGGEEERTKIRVVKEGQSGNPAFLAGIQWCIDKRIELIGLERLAAEVEKLKAERAEDTK